jgi:hypothetical protein
MSPSKKVPGMGTQGNGTDVVFYSPESRLCRSLREQLVGNSRRCFKGIMQTGYAGHEAIQGLLAMTSGGTGT